MSNVKSMENLESLERLLGKIPARNWVFYAKKLGWSKSKVYEYFDSLKIKQKAYSKEGLWYPQAVPVELKHSKEYEKYLAEIKEIIEIALASPNRGWHRFGYFYGLLPSKLKSKISTEVLPIADNFTITQIVKL